MLAAAAGFATWTRQRHSLAARQVTSVSEFTPSRCEEPSGMRTWESSRSFLVLYGGAK